MASGLQFRSLGRFLYTQNPFYLVSCFLIIYGIQTAALSGSTLITQSLIMSGSLAAYLVAMAVTAIGIVRLGKVWEDARSVLLVVVIAQVALSASLDELCITRWNLGAPLLAAAGLLSCLVTEAVLRLCRIQFASWYRLSFYAMQLTFFGMPIVLGRAVEQRQILLTNWAAPLFSLCIGFSLLLLIPAVQRGNALVRKNGTPWRWPLFPLSVFFILVVTAAIRSHAIWMSFGFRGMPVQFEPFLLLPIVFAVLILLVESERSYRRRNRTYFAMSLAPLLLLGGLSNGGMTHLPIQQSLQLYFGSAQTITLALIFLFFLYVWTKGEKGAAVGMIGSLLALAIMGDHSVVATSYGFQSWIYGAVACALMLCTCLRHANIDRMWLGLAATMVTTILIAGRDYHRMSESIWLAASVAGASMLLIGAIFRTELAEWLRISAAVLMTLSAFALAGWNLIQSVEPIIYLLLGSMALVSLVYLPIVRRWGWLYVFSIQSAAFLFVVGWNRFDPSAISNSNWSIQSGVICFVIGLSITSIKSGLHRSCCRTIPRYRPHYRAGF